MRVTKQVFSQDAHCCLMDEDGPPHFTMELMDGGGGEYLVLHANHWALESPEEVDALAGEMKALLAKAQK